MKRLLVVGLLLGVVGCSEGSEVSTSADDPSPNAEVSTATAAVETATAAPTDPGTSAQSPGEPAEVIYVVDGDTIDVVIDGVEERVRYIGIDSPERGACYEDEATAANASLVDGKTVALEPDIQNDRDSFGRLLRYVHVDGLFVNQVLVEGGFAEATTRFPERAYRDVLLAAEAEAKADGRGLWTACPGLFE